MCGETRFISKERYDAGNEKCSCDLVPSNWSLASKSAGAIPVEFVDRAAEYMKNVAPMMHAGTPLVKGIPQC